MIQNKIIHGDCLEKLKELPEKSINMCMTSPPYWALRDYGTASWEGGDENCSHQYGRNTRTLTDKSKIQKGNTGSYGDEAIKTGECCKLCGAKRIDKQLGLESTFEGYINKLCDIFDEVKRVLRDDGSCWVNIGDTYFGSGKGAGGDITKSKECFTFKEKEKRICKNCGKEFEGWKFQNFCGSACSGVDNTSREKKGKLPDKTLTMIPMRFAIEMVNRGWILRNTIIWHKPNCMPSSVKDRFTVDFEYLFFLVRRRSIILNSSLNHLQKVQLRDQNMVGMEQK
jgi:DNA modification methylase